MLRRAGLIMTAGLLAAVFGSASTASAANAEFCRDYARSAVRQAQAVMNSGRCEWIFRNGSQARWSTDWRVHFNWCLSTGYDNANREREARHEAVQRCMQRGWDRGGDRGWDRGDYRDRGDRWPY